MKLHPGIALFIVALIAIGASTFLLSKIDAAATDINFASEASAVNAALPQRENNKKGIYVANESKGCVIYIKSKEVRAIPCSKLKVISNSEIRSTVASIENTLEKQNLVSATGEIDLNKVADYVVTTYGSGGKVCDARQFTKILSDVGVNPILRVGLNVFVSDKGYFKGTPIKCVTREEVLKTLTTFVG